METDEPQSTLPTTSTTNPCTPSSSCNPNNVRTPRRIKVTTLEVNPSPSTSNILKNSENTKASEGVTSPKTPRRVGFTTLRTYDSPTIAESQEKGKKSATPSTGGKKRVQITTLATFNDKVCRSNWEVFGIPGNILNGIYHNYFVRQDGFVNCNTFILHSFCLFSFIYTNADKLASVISVQFWLASSGVYKKFFISTALILGGFSGRDIYGQWSSLGTGDHMWWWYSCDLNHHCLYRKIVTNRYATQLD